MKSFAVGKINISLNQTQYRDRKFSVRVLVHDAVPSRSKISMTTEAFTRMKPVSRLIYVLHRSNTSTVIAASRRQHVDRFLFECRS